MNQEAGFTLMDNIAANLEQTRNKKTAVVNTQEKNTDF